MSGAGAARGHAPTQCTLHAGWLMDGNTTDGLGEEGNVAPAEITFAELDTLYAWVYAHAPAAVRRTGLVRIEDVDEVVDRIIDDVRRSPQRLAELFASKTGLHTVVYCATSRWRADSKRRIQASDKRETLYARETYESREQRSVTEERVEVIELARIVNRAIDRMPPLRRSVFRLMRGEERLSRIKVAQQLGISPDAVKLHMTRALRTLREVEREWRSGNHE
jgi:RNA polymerase sigma factor (sigma-70 family)